MNDAVELLMSTSRLATPLVFAALGGLMSERAGVINIALEGLMIVGAFAAAVAASTSGSPWVGFFSGALAASVAAAVYAFAALECRANQIVAGTGINMLAMGIPPFVSKILYDVTGSTPALELSQRFSFEPMVLVVIALAGVMFWLYRTRSGLWVSFAGEHPEALQAAGLSVRSVRWAAVLASGFFAGMGGACLSVFLSSSYSRNMSAGRGFIALAALILGKWRPLPAALACVLFGFTDAVQIRLQGLELPGIGAVPVQFIQVLPYLVTLVVLAGFVGEARAPKAIGEPLPG
jgi:simple sugar transport system permease protein